MDRNRSFSPFLLSAPISTSVTLRGQSSRHRTLSPAEQADSSFTFDFAAFPLTNQRFDIEATEERFLALQDRVKATKQNLNDCSKCFECIGIIDELEEINREYSRNRVRILNSFLELYMNLQDEMRKNKELNMKNQKLIQEVENNLEAFTERRVNNKLKSLKNDIKHKSQTINMLTEKVAILEKSQENKVKIISAELISKEVVDKEKKLYALNQKVKELNPAFALQDISYSCSDCAKKQSELDSALSELAKLREINSKLLKPKQAFQSEPKNPLTRSMLELKDLIVSWWENKQDLYSSNWKKEGEELIQSLIRSVEVMAESKVEQTGRELRSAVHKKICEVEADFMDLGEKDERVKLLMHKFLELPYLLKPMFDLMKEYEMKELIS
jgi:uncharacterized protein YoxC